ncbi:hypothetical protein NQ317_000393 [Molorchus minor]|uniref:Uncharacterized protein n=1 Tax=Molorchus minor TaxID=1323400 RepID=A0ABQ9J9W5_9CUCU|nr:hypothetical protein NQ317_000393 [Molorchus minor]
MSCLVETLDNSSYRKNRKKNTKLVLYDGGLIGSQRLITGELGEWVEFERGAETQGYQIKESSSLLPGRCHRQVRCPKALSLCWELFEWHRFVLVSGSHPVSGSEVREAIEKYPKLRFYELSLIHGLIVTETKKIFGLHS